MNFSFELTTRDLQSLGMAATVCRCPYAVVSVLHVATVWMIDQSPKMTFDVAS